MPRPRRAPPPAPAETPMTPMIDIVFQLLIFFMLSMHFKDVEGKLLSQLPRHGVRPEETPPVVPLEVRIVLCAGGDPRAHAADKKRHQGEAKAGDPCRVRVEGFDLGEVRRTEGADDRRGANRAVYRAVGAKVRELLPPGAAVVIDADGEVPYEHVVGAVNACKEAGVERIEFAASPR